MAFLEADIHIYTENQEFVIFKIVRLRMLL
jgi:hypothetical protein